MKENKTVLEQLKNKKKIHSLGLFVQFILLIAIIVLAVCSMFIKELNVAMQVLVVLLLFTMSYNNHTLFKRKGFTVLYAVAAFALFVSIVSGYAG